MRKTLLTLTFAVGFAAPTFAQDSTRVADSTAAVVQPTPAPAPAPAPTQSLVELVRADSNYSTLASALQLTGLADALAAEGPFTVFAPTNAAFAKLPPDTLSALMTTSGARRLYGMLMLHIVPGGLYTAAQVPLRATWPTWAGAELASMKMDDGTVMIGAAHIVQPDLAATNGIIHGIDTVLMPAASAGATSGE